MNNFYEKTTKIFSLTITVDSTNPNITNDDVLFTLKAYKTDTDEEALLSSSADVLTEGDVGKAIFTLSPSDTDIDPGKYYYEIKWLTGDNVYILESSTVRVLDRIYD